MSDPRKPQKARRPRQTRTPAMSAVPDTGAKAVGDYYRAQYETIDDVLGKMQAKRREYRHDAVVNAAIVGGFLAASYYRAQNKNRGRGR